MLAFLRGEHAEPFTVAAHLERRGGHLAVQRVVLRDPKMREPIGPAVWALDRRGLARLRSEEHTSELQSRLHLVCRLLLEKKKKKTKNTCISSEIIIPLQVERPDSLTT